jgi:predicted porin
MKNKHRPLAAATAITVACAAALAQAQAQAQAPAPNQVQVYGTFDLAVGQVETQPPGAPTTPFVRVRGVHNGALQTSYIGFRGTEDLGGGLKARFQLEGFFRGDTGQTGRFDATPASAADFFWSREAFVALGGAFGEVRLGNNANPVWVTMLQTNALGSNSVFGPSFRQLFNGGTRGRSEVDTAMVNSVKYVSPVFAGVEINAVLQAGEGSGDGTNYALRAAYKLGALALGASTQKLQHAALPNLPARRDQTMTLIGGSYDFGFARLFAQYTTIDNPRLNTKDKVPHFGFSVPLGAGVLQFSTGEDKVTTTAANGSQAQTQRTTTTLGYVYGLSRRTDLYSFLMTDKVAVGTGDSYVVGIRHRF